MLASVDLENCTRPSVSHLLWGALQGAPTMSRSALWVEAELARFDAQADLTRFGA